MSWKGQHVSVNERLSKLEEELDHLIQLQEKIKTSKASVDCGVVLQRSSNVQQIQQCPCANSATCTRLMPNNTRVVSQCTLRDSAPLADITKFLQHINLNLFKGTQAITKIAKSTTQSRIEGVSNGPYHENCIQKTEPSKHPPLSNSFGKKLDEDAFYKELREEKDKRQRAENQLKQTREDMKKNTIEYKRSSDSRVLQLQEELREALDKLDSTKHELETRNRELQQAEYVWPYRYETARKELQEERMKSSVAEANVQRLQEMLHKMYVNSEELATLKKTSSWLKEQNESLICLSQKLKSEVEDKIVEISRKNRTIEENFTKIKQLSCVCEKLKNFLIVVRRRADDSEEKLKETQSRRQILTDKLLEAHSIQEKDRCERKRLTEQITTLTASNSALQKRVDEMSEIMREQTRLIARQSGTISVKEDQLRLECDNIKVLNKKIEDLEEKRMTSAHFDRLKLDLENNADMLLVKDKIIESHLQSIAQMKNTLDRKEEEIKHRKREITEIERKLYIERTTTAQLELKVKSLQNQKEELKKTVKELEEELETQVSSEEAGRLEQIEKQVKEKQKEWEERKTVLMWEKEKALEALRCLSQKLMDRTTEHQAETATLQRLADKLTAELNEKDTQLSGATEMVSKLTIELKKAEEKVEITRQRFEKKLQSACESWKTTVALLQTDN